MGDTGCPHPETDLVVIEADLTVVWWCPLCGSIRDNNGDHGVVACAWRSPSGLLLPGWTCAGCRAFNGAAKELLTECRNCGAPRKTARTTQASS